MMCANGHTHPSTFEAEKCDGLGYAQAKEDVVKLRAELEHAKVDRDCCCAGTEELRKKLEVVNLQLGELVEMFRRNVHPYAPSVAVVEATYPLLFSGADYKRVLEILQQTEKPKCRCGSHDSGTCVAACDCGGVAEKPKNDVWTEGELKQLHKEADKLSDHLDLPKPAQRVDPTQDCGCLHPWEHAVNCPMFKRKEGS